MTPAERDRVAALVDLGLVDVVRRQQGDTQFFTWWDYRNGAFHRGFGLRIDLVLCSGAITAGLTDAFVDRDARKGKKPSDHAPVVVDFVPPNA